MKNFQILIKLFWFRIKKAKRNILYKQSIFILVLSAVIFVSFVFSINSLIYIVAHLLDNIQKEKVLYFFNNYFILTYLIYFFILALKDFKFNIEPGYYLLPISKNILAFYILLNINMNLLFLYFITILFFVSFMFIINFTSHLSALLWFSTNLLIFVDINLINVFLFIKSGRVKHLAMLFFVGIVFVFIRAVNNYSMNFCVSVTQVNFNTFLLFFMITVIIFLTTLKYIASIKLEKNK